MIRLVLVEDHPLFRLGLATLIGRTPDMQVVGETSSYKIAVELVDRLQPDVVVMDARLRRGDGVEACRAIRARQPQTRILMLSSFTDENSVVTSLAAGASGFVTKDSGPEELVKAIETVAQGGSWLDPAVIQVLLGWMRRGQTTPSADPLAALSPQERNILPLIAEGKINREIAKILSLSENTVKTYISDILQKLHLARRSELAAFVTRVRKSEHTK